MHALQWCESVRTRRSTHLSWSRSSLVMMSALSSTVPLLPAEMPPECCSPRPKPKGCSSASVHATVLVAAGRRTPSDVSSLPSKEAAKDEGI